MLKQLAPYADMPPSPKKIACTNNATEMASIDIQGPRTIAEIPIPTACPVVPPGSGKLNIISTNENAEKTARSGTACVASFALTRFIATYQKGVAAAYRPAQVLGLR